MPGSAPRWFTPPKTVIHLGTTDRRDRVERVTATLNRQPILLVVVVTATLNQQPILLVVVVTATLNRQPILLVVVVVV